MVLDQKRHLETSNLFSLFTESSLVMMKNQEKKAEGDTHSVLHIYLDYILQQKSKISSVCNWKCFSQKLKIIMFYTYVKSKLDTFCYERSDENLELLKAHEISQEKKSDLDLETLQKRLS